MRIPLVWEREENKELTLAYKDGYYDGKDSVLEGGTQCDNSDEFGVFLKWVLKDKGLTIKELGEMCEFPTSTISNWVIGRQIPNLSTMSRLLDALGYKLWILKEE